MQISTTPDPIFPLPKDKPRGLVRNITANGMTMEPEQTEEEKRLANSTISFQRQLTPEEENRVLFLKNMLAQLLTMSGGQPTEEQKSRIKEIEKELEKITGVKMQSSLSNATDKMPEVDDEEEEERKKEQAARGIPPEEAVHKQRTDYGQSTNPGMQMLQRNASFLKLDSLLNTPLSIDG